MFLPSLTHIRMPRLPPQHCEFRMRGHYHCLRTGCYFVTNITTKLPWHIKKHEKAERRAANGFKYFTKREECGRLGTEAKGGQGLSVSPGHLSRYCCHHLSLMICERYHRPSPANCCPPGCKASEPRHPRETARAAPSIIPTPRQQPGAALRHPQFGYSCFPEWRDKTRMSCEPFSFEGFVQNELFVISVIYSLFKTFSICL